MSKTLNVYALFGNPRKGEGRIISLVKVTTRKQYVAYVRQTMRIARKGVLHLMCGPNSLLTSKEQAFVRNTLSRSLNMMLGWSIEEAKEYDANPASRTQTKREQRIGERMHRLACKQMEITFA